MPIDRAFVSGGSGFVGRTLLAELRRRNVPARALVRSAAAERVVREAGVEPAHGDLQDADALQRAVAGCDVVFHAAAMVYWGDFAEFHKVNVDGTNSLLRAAGAAGVRRFIHVSTDAVLAGAAAIVNADERTEKPRDPYGAYTLTKSRAEDAVLAANRPGFETIVVRPGFVWGAGDTTLLPRLVAAVRAGKYRWIDHGRYAASVTHVGNVAEGLVLAAERGHGGAVYFVTDGAPIDIRTFITRMLETQGVTPGDRNIPRRHAWRLAGLVEVLWQTLRLKTSPPITRMVVKMMGEEFTVNDAKARRELGYVGRVSFDEGLEAMRAGVSAARSGASRSAGGRAI